MSCRSWSYLHFLCTFSFTLLLRHSSVPFSCALLCTLLMHPLCLPFSCTVFIPHAPFLCTLLMWLVTFSCFLPVHHYHLESHSPLPFSTKTFLFLWIKCDNNHYCLQWSVKRMTNQTTVQYVTNQENKKSVSRFPTPHLHMMSPRHPGHNWRKAGNRERQPVRVHSTECWGLFGRTAVRMVDIGYIQISYQYWDIFAG